MRGDNCEECGKPERYAAKPGDEVCDCAQRRRALLKAKHVEAMGHLSNALETVDGKKLPPEIVSAAMMTALVRSLLALLQCSPPGDY